MSPFTCIIIVLITCLVTFVGVSSIMSKNEEERINELRDEWAEYTKYNTMNELASDDIEKYNKLAQLLALIDNDTIHDYNKEDLWDHIYKSLPGGIGDEHGEYMTKEEYDEYLSSSSGTSAGIGLRVAKDDTTNGVYIHGIVTDSPASLSGLQVGDVIIEAGGVNSDYDAIVAAIPGKPDTNVELKVMRGEEIIEVTITRGYFPSENVIYEKLEGNVAYIKIITFMDTTLHTQFEEKIKLAQSEGCESYIFDVRNNTGGFLTTTCLVLDQLLPEGPIVNIIDANDNVETEKSDAKCLDAPMVVLCNQETASAAELFVAALRDYELAESVGNTTFGKGSAQDVEKFKDGSALKISTSLYTPPFSENYNGTGITPDHVVELDKKWENIFFKMPKEEDTQLLKALELLNSAE